MNPLIERTKEIAALEQKLNSLKADQEYDERFQRAVSILEQWLILLNEKASPTRQQISNYELSIFPHDGRSHLLPSSDLVQAIKDLAFLTKLGFSFSIRSFFKCDLEVGSEIVCGKLIDIQNSAAELSARLQKYYQMSNFKIMETVGRLNEEEIGDILLEQWIQTGTQINMDLFIRLQSIQSDLDTLKQDVEKAATIVPVVFQSQ